MKLSEILALPDARTQEINQLRALLVSAPQDVRDKLWKSKPHECVSSCIYYEAPEYSPLCIALCSALRSLAKRWVALTEELKELDESLKKLTRKYASNLCSQFGVGPQTAATLLAVACDNPERLKMKQHWHHFGRKPVTSVIRKISQAQIKPRRLA